MKVYLKEAMEWLFPDKISQVNSGLESPVFDAPRGGIVSVAAVVNGLNDGDRIAVAADNSDVCVFEMLDVCVNRNTSEHGFAERAGVEKSHSVIRNAPFREYDALKPLDGDVISRNGVAALLVQIPIKYNAVPGETKYTISFSAGKEIKEVCFSVRVSSVKIPKTGKNSVYFTNWFSLDNFAFYAKTEFWTPRFWDAVKEQAEMMFHARQNTFILPLKPFFEYKDGNYTLNSRRMKKFIDIFTEAGLYWIEGGHFGSRNGGWTAPDFKVMCSDHSVRSMEGNRDIAQIARQLKAFMDKYDLKKRWIQHVTDEPILENADSYRIFTELIRKYLPGIPILDAMSDPEIAGACDIWCPQVQLYQRRKNDFDATREQGDHIWAYTCCMPGGIWLNRLCDEELARPLLLGWGCAANQIEGFLHWGWNYYLGYKNQNTSRQNPFEETSPHEFGDSTNILPPGDTHVVYPGEHGSVWSSMRLEAQRQGLEDWELIRILQKKAPQKCKTIVSKVFRGFDDYTPDAALIGKLRGELLKELEK